MLHIENLQVNIPQQNILNKLHLSVPAGQVHAIMGPNGSGKSTLSKTIAGHPDYEVTQGAIEFLGQDILTLSAEERARRGIFLGFQYPVEIPGVNNIYFLRTAFNAQRAANDLAPLDTVDFMRLLKQKAALLDMDEKYFKRAVNAGFSGGEKKRNEILQMLVLEPRLAILDETDSGLDIDALQIIAKGINQLRADDRSIILVTHYQRLLDYVKPDVVHVMINGRIVETGGPELAQKLEQKGYAWLTKDAVENAGVES